MHREVQHVAAQEAATWQYRTGLKLHPGGVGMPAITFALLKPWESSSMTKPSLGSLHSSPSTGSFLFTAAATQIVPFGFFSALMSLKGEPFTASSLPVAAPALLERSSSVNLVPMLSLHAPLPRGRIANEDDDDPPPGNGGVKVRIPHAWNDNAPGRATAARTAARSMSASVVFESEMTRL